MADLSQTLLACQNPDPQIRNAAEAALISAEQTNLAQFFLALSTELSTEGRDPNIRQLAGLHLKNLLSAKDEILREQKVTRYKTAVDVNTRVSLKTLVLGTLRSPETAARHTAAQACAELAAADLPNNEWNEFLPALMKNVSDEVSADEGVNAVLQEGIKVSALECLGFTCELLANYNADINQDITNQMLTTIVGGIRSDRPDAVRLAATVALKNSLMFTSNNMENLNERNMIMQTICEGTQCTEPRVRVAAYECIGQIAYQYYDKLADYMTTIFQLTFATIKSDDESVALQAIEFWNILCEEEMELIDEENELATVGEQLEGRAPCPRYVAAALEHLIPLLTEVLTKQDEDADADEDTWNMAMAGATCINLVANTVEDKVVPAVMPFVQANIQSTEWRLKEASTMAFGSILEGPTQAVIGPFVNQSIPILLTALSDAHTMVKDTTAWTLGRICDLHVLAIPQDLFPSLVTGLTNILMTESPRVSSQACFALHNLAAAFALDENQSGTNALSPYMPTLLQTLLQVTERDGWDECNLRQQAYEAVNVLIQHSAPDCVPLFEQMLPVILDRLQGSFAMAVLTNEDRETKEALQGLLCGLVQVIEMKIEKEKLVPYADNIMQCMLQVLTSKNATAHEEAFMCTGALADRLEKDFEKYLPHLHPYVLSGLRNFEAYQVCAVAVGLVGDISRAVEAAILPFCDEIITALLESLQNSTLHRNVKPPVLSSFGDVALAIGAGFEKYLQVTLMMLMQASQTKAPDDDEDLIDYINILREGILEAYTGIIQGMKDGKRAQVLLPYKDSMMGFLEQLSNDNNKDREVLSKAIGCLGDIASSLGPHVRDDMSKPYVQALLKEGFDTGEDSIKQTCMWANGVVQQIIR